MKCNIHSMPTWMPWPVKDCLSEVPVDKRGSGQKSELGFRLNPGHLCLWCLTCSTTVPSCTLPGPTGQSSLGCWSWNSKHWATTVAPGRSLSLYGKVMELCLKDTGKEKQNSHQATVRFPRKICFLKGENAKIRQTNKQTPLRHLRLRRAHRPSLEKLNRNE